MNTLRRNAFWYRQVECRNGNHDARFLRSRCKSSIRKDLGSFPHRGSPVLFLRGNCKNDVFTRRPCCFYKRGTPFFTTAYDFSRDCLYCSTRVSRSNEYGLMCAKHGLIHGPREAVRFSHTSQKCAGVPAVAHFSEVWLNGHPQPDQDRYLGQQELVKHGSGQAGTCTLASQGTVTACRRVVTAGMVVASTANF